MDIEYSKQAVKAINSMDKKTKQRIKAALEGLPEQEQILLFEIVKRFVPDDIATADDLAAIEAARAEYARGETVSHEGINWN